MNNPFRDMAVVPGYERKVCWNPPLLALNTFMPMVKMIYTYLQQLMQKVLPAITLLLTATNARPIQLPVCSYT